MLMRKEQNAQQAQNSPIQKGFCGIKVGGNWPHVHVGCLNGMPLSSSGELHVFFSEGNVLAVSKPYRQHQAFHGIICRPHPYL